MTHSLKILLSVAFLLLTSSSSHSQVVPQPTAKDLNKQFESLLDEFVITNDSTLMYRLVGDIIILGQQCDSIEQSSNKRQPTVSHFREKHQQLLQVMRRLLVDAGLYHYRQHQLDKAEESFSLYITTAVNPLFVSSSANDPFLDETTYYLAMINYEKGDFDKANQRANALAESNDYSRKAADLKLLCMRQTMTSESDSLVYRDALASLHEAFPTDNHYFSMLVDYYSWPSRHAQYLDFLTKETITNASNTEAFMLSGDEFMKQKQWESALNQYTQALTTTDDHEFEAAIYYNMGLCYSSIAIEEHDKTTSLNRLLNKKQRNYITELLNSAVTFFDQSRRLDPDRAIVDWARPMYHAYRLMRNKQKCEELLPLISK